MAVGSATSGQIVVEVDGSTATNPVATAPAGQGQQDRGGSRVRLDLGSLYPGAAPGIPNHRRLLAFNGTLSEKKDAAGDSEPQKPAGLVDNPNDVVREPDDVPFVPVPPPQDPPNKSIRNLGIGLVLFGVVGGTIAASVLFANPNDRLTGDQSQAFGGLATGVGGLFAVLGGVTIYFGTR